MIASVGERLTLIYSARVESELWRECIDATARPHNLSERAQLVSYKMSRRAFLELQTLYLMSVGHGLANVAARFLALDDSLREHLSEQLLKSIRRRPALEPGSKARIDWLSLTDSVAKALTGTARYSQKDAVAALIDPIATYASSAAWKDFAERRGTDFHQWRPQTAGISGASLTPPTTLDDGTVKIGFGGPVDYRDADSLNEELDRLVSGAIQGALDAMEQFRANFEAAASSLISEGLSITF